MNGNNYPTYEKAYLLILNFFQAVDFTKMVIAFLFFLGMTSLNNTFGDVSSLV